MMSFEIVSGSRSQSDYDDPYTLASPDAITNNFDDIDI
jgi:hypothetical protein